jgi:hypothetical protein
MLSRVFLVTVLLFGLFSPAYSQNAQRVVPLVGSPLLPINSGNPVPVTGTLSATIGGFTPSGNYATLTANGSSARSALPSGSPTVVVAYNTGTTAVSCVLGGSGVTATTNEDQIAPGGFFSYTVGTNTYLACIDQTGSASNVVVLSGGTGIATGSGGGGGSGSGGAVYGPTAAGSAAANPPVLMGGTVDGTSTGNVDNWKVASGLGYVSGILPSASVASGAFASGSISSGAVASGAFASGSLASGAGTDGWNVTEGTKADSAWSSGSGSIVAILKTVATNTGSIIPGCKIQATTTCTVIGSVFNGANTYNTVAASQTTQALTGGGGGATGDYLSHCTVIPATTAPGVVTILDNATAIYSFVGGGTYALSNAIPFTIPVGAKSTSGAWKVTTGANVSVVCVGAFT